MGRSFGNENLNDYWNNTIKLVNSYQEDNLDYNLANACAHNLWHLCEWYYIENREDLECNSLSDFQGRCGNEKPNLRAMRDICNTTKHKLIERTRNPAIESVNKYIGEFSPDFSSEFNISVLKMELPNGTEIDFEDAVKDVLNYWRMKIGA